MSPHPISPVRLIRLGFFVGLALSAAAILWTGLIQHHPVQQRWFPTAHPLPDVLLGAILGVISAGIVWGLTAVLPAFQKLRQQLIFTLNFDAMTIWHALLLGVLAAVPEEVFFRGAMQPTIGLLLTAFIFGALHALSLLYFCYALLAGIGLGVLVNWRGDLWAATTAHFVYDSALFLLLIWHVQQNKTMIGNKL